MRRLGVRSTILSCYIGYITQAIINNFAPLLFLTFQSDYGISLTLIGTMITVNFGVQLLVDLLIPPEVFETDSTLKSLIVFSLYFQEIPVICLVYYYIKILVKLQLA